MLKDKVQQLKEHAHTATRVAEFWEKQIHLHGEDRATAFYTSLGLNHLEQKSVEWEGMTFWREPTEMEKIAVKDVADAQESGKSTIAKILKALKAKLTQQAIDEIFKLKPEEFHTLVLELPDAPELLKALDTIYMQGRVQVAKELTAQGVDVVAPDAAEAAISAEMQSLSDFLLSRTANSVASRVTDIATEQVILGRTGNDLESAVTDAAEALSDAPEERTAAGGANSALGAGRKDEAIANAGEVDHIEFSSLLDSNTCDECFSEDGTVYDSIDDAPDTPYAFCQGGSLCRCFLVYVVK
jgi:hypothetical protein